jgi:hypothetical protein
LSGIRASFLEPGAPDKGFVELTGPDRQTGDRERTAKSGRFAKDDFCAAKGSDADNDFRFRALYKMDSQKTRPGGGGDIKKKSFL